MGDDGHNPTEAAPRAINKTKLVWTVTFDTTTQLTTVEGDPCALPFVAAVLGMARESVLELYRKHAIEQSLRIAPANILPNLRGRPQ
jgi:hypothetical protein